MRRNSPRSLRPTRADGGTKTRLLGDLIFSSLTTILLLYFIYMVSFATVVPYLHSFFLARTDGTVQSVGIGGDSISVGTSDGYYVGNAFYFPKIEFNYSVGGEVIVADHYLLAGRAFDSAEQAKSIASMYRVGEKVTVWYSVIDHHYAVLDPQVSYAKATVGGIVLFFCIAVVWRMISNIVRQHVRRET